jgi:enamine deaminase RidA (YjgF/YER057c/UK114 family)
MGRIAKMEIRRIWPANVYRLGHPSWDVPACAQVVEIARSAPGRSIHVAGTYGWGLDCKQIATDMAGQVRATLDNILRSLAAVGAAPSDVVRVKSYVTDMEAFQREGIGEFRKFWGAAVPTSTLVQVVRLGDPNALIEIEVYAETA